MKTLRIVLIVVLGLTGLCMGAYLLALPEAIAPFLNAILMVALPVTLGVVIARRTGAAWRLFGIGAVTFVASQVLHIPFNAWTLNPLLESLGVEVGAGGRELIMASVALGLSAGVFEETARYIVYARWLDKARSWKDGLMLGAGHGGAEAIILGGLVLATFLQMLTLRNADLSNFVAPDQIEAAQAQVEAYWSSPWYLHLLGAVERGAALIFHLSASLLVMQAFIRRNILWYLLAIAWHTTLNAVAVYGSQSWSLLATEGVIWVGALLSLGIVLALRRREEETAKEEAAAPPLRPVPENEIEINAERLKDSQYE